MPAPSATIEGNVYNITDEFEADENFVSSEVGNTYPAGTNIVCIEESDSVFKYDVLASFIDTSNLATTTQLTEGLAKKVDKVEGSSLVSDTLITKLTNLANIQSVSSELDVSEAGQLSVASVAQSKVTGLDTALQGKVDKVSGSSLVKDTLITKLTNLATINEVNSTDFSLSGGTLSLNTISQDKVTGLTEALAGKISGIKTNGTLIEAVDGVVNIPLAGNGIVGLVTSSTAENNVAVNADGTMTVNSLNINKLVQTDGEFLILDGGNSGAVQA